ncbi:hypothetical protein BpHYR1_047968 [Brachionus plicatilis]|uniref:Uncharacterized protein n=1 Tax=Brachionus plicatilis TaxID=10195 RepID=A0A3M7TA02_BRAPC|nr:hypothetical protein BpHYR1_047968 [Brachionus plicatilis]
MNGDQVSNHDRDKSQLSKRHSLMLLRYLEFIIFYSSQSYDLHQIFYQYLIHLDHLKEFFHNLSLTFTITIFYGLKLVLKNASAN